MKTGVDKAITQKDIIVHNSRGNSIIWGVIAIFITIFLLNLYLSGKDTRAGTLIGAIVSIIGVFFFIYKYFDRGEKIRIKKMSIIIHGKEFFWKDVKDVKLKVYSGAGTSMSKEYLVLVLVDESSKNGCREFESQIIGYDKTYTEIITYAKTYKKIYDERVSGKTPSTPSFRSDRRDMDSRQLAMLKKTDTELLEIINDGDNQKAIDYIAARNELKKRREQN
jgi:hypothetical protein